MSWPHLPHHQLSNYFSILLYHPFHPFWQIPFCPQITSFTIRINFLSDHHFAPNSTLLGWIAAMFANKKQWAHIVPIKSKGHKLIVPNRSNFSLTWESFSTILHLSTCSVLGIAVGYKLYKYLRPKHHNVENFESSQVEASWQIQKSVLSW